MNVATLIKALQERAEPTDEVYLIVSENIRYSGGEILRGIFTGKVIGTGTGAKTGQCEIYAIS